MIRSCVLSSAALLIVCLAAFAQEKPVGKPGGKPKPGPLASLPSKLGPHLDKIKALGDDQWLNLGAPAPDPAWGKARGSSWGAKAMILCPEKRGAFLMGEGVHAFVKPDGHIMDDLWFYDLNAHAWLCLHPGTNTETFSQRVKDGELRIDERGLLIDGENQTLPVHTLLHAWSYLAYDPDRKKFTFLGGDGLGRYFLGDEKRMDEGVTLLERQLKARGKRLYSPWFYDVDSGRFERSLATGSKPYDSFSQLHYLPAIKKFIVVGSGSDGVGYFDPAKNQWSEARPKGPHPKGYDAVGCYDSKRNRVYRNDGDNPDGRGLMAYDIESNTWIELKPQGPAPAPANTNAAYYEYDARLDVVVAIHFKGKTPGIHIYDPAANAWAAPLAFPPVGQGVPGNPGVPGGPKFQFAANTFYDKELNAYFCHLAGDSSDNGVIWVYRYKK